MTLHELIIHPIILLKLVDRSNIRFGMGTELFVIPLTKVVINEVLYFCIYLTDLRCHPAGW